MTLEQFAFYGASALYAVNPSQKAIQVTGNNGSSVSVRIGLAWDDFNFNIKLGRLGEFGVDNVPYPSINEAEVTAYDINHRVVGELPNNGRFSYSALKAKCKQIQAEKDGKVTQRQALFREISSRGYRPSSAEIAFLTGQSPYLYLRGDRDGPPPPCHGINGNSGHVAIEDKSRKIN